MRYHGIFDKHKRPQRLQWQTGNEFDESDFTGNRFTGGKDTKDKLFLNTPSQNTFFWHFWGAKLLKYYADKDITKM